MKEVKGLILKDKGSYIEAIPKELENINIIDARKILKFEKSQGFETIEDVAEYIKSYF